MNGHDRSRAPPLWRGRRSLPRRVRTRLNNIERSRLRIIFVVLALGPLALLAYVALGISTSVIREREKSRLQQEANLSATYIERELGGLAEIVESFGHRPTVVDSLTNSRRPESAANIKLNLNQLVRVRTRAARSPRPRSGRRTRLGPGH